MLYSNAINLIGLTLEGGVSTQGLLSVNKSVSTVRGYVDQVASLEFEAGTESDTPVVNLALARYPFTERLDMYFDIGATDPDRDLDALSYSSLYPLYIDPAYAESEGHAVAGVLPPKLVVMRCLLGSGLVYLNLLPSLEPVAKYVAPLTLHANAGLFCCTFPRGKAHAAQVQDDRIALAIVSIFLRTFEEANRFQLVVFK